MSNDLLSLIANEGSLSANQESALAKYLFQILTPEQAALELSLSPDKVIEEAIAGRLPGRKIAGEWRFLRENLIRYLRVDKQPLATPSLSSGPWNEAVDKEAEAEIAALRKIREEFGFIESVSV